MPSTSIAVVGIAGANLGVKTMAGGRVPETAVWPLLEAWARPWMGASRINKRFHDS